MQEQIKPQAIPVNIYSTNGRLMVTAPMAGMEPENITIEVAGDGRRGFMAPCAASSKGHDGKQRFLATCAAQSPRRSSFCALARRW